MKSQRASFVWRPMKSLRFYSIYVIINWFAIVSWKLIGSHETTGSIQRIVSYSQQQMKCDNGNKVRMMCCEKYSTLHCWLWSWRKEALDQAKWTASRWWKKWGNWWSGFWKDRSGTLLPLESKQEFHAGRKGQ